MNKHNTVLIIDAGGRGAALVHAYSKSPYVSRILAIPGNDLMQINTKKPVKIFPRLTTTSVKEIVEIAKKEKVDLVDVAQDNAVAAGVTNALQKAGIATIGPTKKAGQIEWDKAWSREFMKKYHLPYPQYYIFHSEEEGKKFLKENPNKKWFIKASGLAEGKGVLPAESNKEAEQKIAELRRFGDSGKIYLLEEWLIGEEFSAFALCDGEDFIAVGTAQDHKRMFNFDEGENTGGMGCSTPPLVITPQISKQAHTIFKKTLHGLVLEDRPYNGILYLGGMIVRGKVYIIEFNARWGSPEAEVLVPSITSDFFAMNFYASRHELKRVKIKTDKKSRVAVALALRKGAPLKKRRLYGIIEAQKISGVTLYGTRILASGKKHYALSGRLVFVVGEGKNVIDARRRAYKAASCIYLEGNNLHYRTDIGWRDVERLMKTSKTRNPNFDIRYSDFYLL